MSKCVRVIAFIKVCIILNCTKELNKFNNFTAKWRANSQFSINRHLISGNILVIGFKSANGFASNRWSGNLIKLGDF
jgi:hypothetical protein